ncbi:uncharacterized protein LOC120437327 [Oreochromis aureus]|uniref:uncharacterized protein LOC120437327 n=1 Tax=Oreochromis aureus TaxID=47969 RepID=UPI0019537241|nr:uncharacterized protein LOC120437327 [Oreochromis aureus]
MDPTEDIPLEQSWDDTLRSAYDQVIDIDGHLVCPEAARTYPHTVTTLARMKSLPSCWCLKAAGTKLHRLGRLSQENLLQAQQCQQSLYNRGTRLRQFSPGDKMLVLLPSSSSKLLAKWQGSFVITRRVGDVDYEVAWSDRGGATQIYHLNLLKAWREAETAALPTSLHCDDHLTQAQRADVAALQQCFADVFSPLPGRTSLIEHHVETQLGVTVHSRPYRLPEHKRQIDQRELNEMLRMGVIEESHSAWFSPIVLVMKKDGSIRFCVDYHKVNEVSQFDAYPMPRVDELLDRLGTARCFTTLDLAKGYWQIPLSVESKEKQPSPLRTGCTNLSHFGWLFRSPRHLSAPYGLGAAAACCICCRLPG